MDNGHVVYEYITTASHIAVNISNIIRKYLKYNMCYKKTFLFYMIRSDYNAYSILKIMFYYFVSVYNSVKISQVPRFLKIKNIYYQSCQKKIC